MNTLEKLAFKRDYIRSDFWSCLKDILNTADVIPQLQDLYEFEMQQRGQNPIYVDEHRYNQLMGDLKYQSLGYELLKISTDKNKQNPNPQSMLDQMIRKRRLILLTSTYYIRAKRHFSKMVKKYGLLKEIENIFQESDFQEFKKQFQLTDAIYDPQTTSVKEFMYDFYQLCNLVRKMDYPAHVYIETLKGTRKLSASKTILVDMNEIATTQAQAPKTILGSWRGRDCFIIALYNPQVKEGTIGHFDPRCDITRALKTLTEQIPMGPGVQAHVVGGLRSDRSAENVLRYKLKKMKIELITDRINHKGEELLALDVETGQVFTDFSLSNLLYPHKTLAVTNAGIWKKHFLKQIDTQPLLHVTYNGKKDPLHGDVKMRICGYKRIDLQPVCARQNEL